MLQASNLDHYSIHNVVMVGEPAVGKSSLVNRYVSNLFGDEMVKNLGVNVVKYTTPVGRHEMNMLLWDVRGGLFLKHPALWREYLRKAEGIILTYDCQRPVDSWANLDAALCVLGKVPVAAARVDNEAVEELKAALLNRPTTIVANKVDLGVKEAFERSLAERAEAIGVKPHFASARGSEGVREAFDDIVKQLRKPRYPRNIRRLPDEENT